MRRLLGAVLLLASCAAPIAAPRPTPSATAIATPAPTEVPTPTATSTPPPSAATGGIEVFATGTLHGPYVWLVREEFAAQDRVTETLYAVPPDGSPPVLAVRRLRARQAMGVVASRQVSPDGTKLALEQANLGPAAHDGFVVVDLKNGRIVELARGDARGDVMPAWSPDGRRLAYARRNPGATPIARDDGLWVIDAEGTGARQVLPPAQFAQVTYVFGWTADGRGIAFGLAFEGVGYSIVDAATGAVTGPSGFVMGLAPASWRTRAPQFVGAFTEGDKGGEQRIDVADAIGAPPRTIFHEASDVANGDPLLLNARWSPIADQILYLRTGRQGKLMLVSVTGGTPTEVKIDGQPFKAEWLPDGRIAFITISNGIGSVLNATDGTTQTVLLSFQPSASFTDLAVRAYP